MRFASLIVTFIFLGAAAAGVVPDITRRGTAIPASDGTNGKGGHNMNASMSGVPSPTGTSVHSIPSNIPSQSLPSHMGGNSTSTPSLHPMSGGPAPTATGNPAGGGTNGKGGHNMNTSMNGIPSHPSGSPTGTSVPSNIPSQSPPSHTGGNSTSVPSLHSMSGGPAPTATGNDTHHHNAGSPTGASRRSLPSTHVPSVPNPSGPLSHYGSQTTLPQPHYSGAPSGATGLPDTILPQFHSNIDGVPTSVPVPPNSTMSPVPTASG